MRVVVVGAGEVGTHVAQLLSREGSDVTVVECNPSRIAQIDKLLDVTIVPGSATDPSVMRSAGVGSADLLVAATSIDEVNLVASLIAKLEGTNRIIVRLERPGIRSEKAKALHDAVGATLVIDPDESVAREILDLLSYPGAAEIARLADDEILMVGATLADHAPFTGMSLSEIGAKYEPDWDFIVCTITRDGQTIVPRKDFRLQSGDSVRVVCKNRVRAKVLRELGLETVEHHRIMILGGGRTGEILARALEAKGHIVAIIDRDPARTRELADELDGVLVLEGDITDASLLEEEAVGTYDAVVALTGEDDANILACLFAKKSGARETIAVLHRLELRHLLRDAGVDVAISPRTASANAVLRTVHGGVSAVATTLDDDIEFFEIEVDPLSDAAGASVRELGLPRDTLIAAIVRNGKPKIGRADLHFQAGDHVVFVAHGEDVDHLSRVFTA
ncbi:MAG: Trk system potassium transporter TrkA [Actinomycetota bacterium]